jgi:hypothetical protein
MPALCPFPKFSVATVLSTKGIALPDQLPEREIRRNTAILVVNGGVMQVAMAFVSSDMVLPAFVQLLTTSTVLIGMAGSLMRIGWAWPRCSFHAWWNLANERCPFSWWQERSERSSGLAWAL